MSEAPAPLAKTAVNELAVFGGPPMFTDVLHVGRPNLGDTEALLARFRRILDARWLTNDGPLVRELEERLAAILGVRHCVAVCNGTVALELAARALDLSGEVIVPAFTFVATAHSLRWMGIAPVFCDIDPLTHTIDPVAVEALVTPRTSAIVGVHLWGRPCDVEALADVAARHHLPLLYDAAHALGCSHRGRMVGGFGRAEILSLHATKFVSAGEGGAIVTNDDAVAERCRLTRNFGFSGLDRVVSLGTNGKMPELAAAVALSSLDAMERIVAINRRNHAEYARRLAAVPGLTVLQYDDRERCNYQYIVVEVNEGEAGLSRDQLVTLLHAENVRARRYFWPGCHRMEPYRSDPSYAGLALPHTEEVAARVLVLPTGEAVGTAAVVGITNLLALAVGNAQLVRARLEAARREHAP